MEFFVSDRRRRGVLYINFYVFEDAESKNVVAVTKNGLGYRISKKVVTVPDNRVTVVPDLVQLSEWR